MAKRRAKTRTVTRYVRAKPRSSRRKNKSSELMTLLWMGVGAGSAGAIGGVVNSYAPQISSNIGAGIAGYGLMTMTKGVGKNIGKGMLIKSVGDLIEDNVMPLIMGSGSSTQTTNSTVYG